MFTKRTKLLKRDQVLSGKIRPTPEPPPLTPTPTPTQTITPTQTQTQTQTPTETPTQTNTQTVTPPSYDLYANKSSVDENHPNNTVTFTLETTLVPNNTDIRWVVNGIDIEREDFVAGTPLVGFFNIQNGLATKTFVIKADATTEGPETIRMTLSSAGVPELSAEVVINDTSLTPPDFTLYSDKLIYNEGEIATFTLETEGVAHGSIIPFQITGDVITNDLDSSHTTELTGLFTIQPAPQTTIHTAGSATIQYKFKEDILMEETEEMTVTLQTVGIYTCPPEAIGKAATVEIIDTSFPDPIYYLTVDSLTANETTAPFIRFNLSAENIRQSNFPVTVPWKITGQNTLSDFVPATQLSGTFVLSDNNTKVTKTFKVLADSITDGNKTSTLTLTSINGLSCPTEAEGQTKSVLVYDTSLTPPGYTLDITPDIANETDANIINVNLVTTGVANGTIVPFTISGLGITTLDFETMNPALSGFFEVTTASTPPNLTPIVTTKTFVISADKTVEATETLRVRLSSIGTNTLHPNAVGVFDEVAILDTSLPNALFDKQDVYAPPPNTFNLYDRDASSRSAHQVSSNLDTKIILGRQGTLSLLPYAKRVVLIKNNIQTTKLQTKTTAYNNAYTKAAMSFDTNKLIVVEGPTSSPTALETLYHYSSVGGTDWPAEGGTGITLPNTSSKVKEVFFADNGNIAYMLFRNGLLYKTNNPSSTANWSQITGMPNIKSVHTSKTTSKVIICTPTAVYVSTDNGINWIDQNLTGITDFTSVSISDNGANLFALTVTGKVYRKINAGAWTSPVQLPTTGGNNSYSYLSLTETGQYIHAANTNTVTNQTSTVFISNDFGATWTEFKLLRLGTNTYYEIYNTQIYIDPTTSQIRLFASDASRRITTYRIPI